VSTAAGAGGDSGAAAVLEHGLTDVIDAGVFLTRLIRLDPAAVVRLRSLPGEDLAGQGRARTGLWARLPWGVLVSRVVAGRGPGDATVAAAALREELDRGGEWLPRRRDADWRWPLPAKPGKVVETLPGAELRRIVAAAAGTVRGVTTSGIDGRAIGARVLREALLDHVAVVVTVGEAPTGERIEIPQRLIQAVARMGFLPPTMASDLDMVRVRVGGSWVGLSAPFGTAWVQRANRLRVEVNRAHPFG
jgi:hypothetical protein